MTRQIDIDTLPRARWRATLLLGFGALTAIGIVLTAAVLVVRSTMPEPRPIVLTVYCASSATWVNTLAPFFEAQPQADAEPERGRVTPARIKSAYERRCTTPD